MLNFIEILNNEILPYVEKPSRYIGNELNSIKKDHKNKTSVVLIYPDIYEIGISNIGLKILYNILNNEDDIVCERAYSPWYDFEYYLRKYNLPLYSLESKKPISEFDIIGVTFQYELVYTNFINILDLSRIPFFSKDRNNNHPFVIAGGPTVINCEPIAKFIDAVCIGDGETRILEIVKTIKKGKKNKLSKNEILIELSNIDGVYVPSLYDEEFQNNGYIIPKGKIIKRYIENDINNLPFPIKQIIPNIQSIQDRAVIEISRGCVNNCRFCQAGYLYRPVRERNINNILHLARETIKYTGYTEFSLISLSVSDYSNLDLLIESIQKQFSEHGISFSLPSLRIDTFNISLAEKVKEIRKTGLTFAVEGGNNIIRDAINKNIYDEQLLNVLNIAKDLGWNYVKLYFMIGLLPNNLDYEVEGIIDLISMILEKIKNLKLTLSIATFIPKPHTPLQWNKQVKPEIIKNYFDNLLIKLKKFKKINIRFNNPYISYLEGIFSRGDRKLANIIIKAFQKGARFDSWNDKLNIEIWNNCFEDEKINQNFYIDEKDINSILPWEIINLGCDKKFLQNEYENYLNKRKSQNCKTSCKNKCNICDFKNIFNKFDKTKKNEIIIDNDFLTEINIKSESKYYLRFIFTKTYTFKYFSGIELEEFLSKAFIRANLPIVFTKGFNPRIKLELSNPIPVGFSSYYELGQVAFSKEININEFINKLNNQLPNGIKILKAKITNSKDKLSKTFQKHIVKFKINKKINYLNLLENLEKCSSFEKSTFKSNKIINLKNLILNIEEEKNNITIKYTHLDGFARIQDIIKGLTNLDVKQALILEPTILERFNLNNEYLF